MNTAPQTISVGTINLGAAKLPEVRALLRRERHVSVWAMQEAGDRDYLPRLATRLGWAILDGHGRPGEASTPLLVDPDTWLIREQWTRLLLGRCDGGDVHPLYAGPGAGPAWLKPKWIIGARMRHRAGGVSTRIGSLHYPASQYMPRREALARLMSRRIARAARDYTSALILPGDFNARPDARTLDPLRPRLNLTQAAPHHGHVATHGNRPIDGMAFRPNSPAGRLRLIDAERLRSIGSDHRPYVATFTITKGT